MQDPQELVDPFDKAYMLFTKQVQVYKLTHVHFIL